jgi:hypothetical protein
MRLTNWRGKQWTIKMMLKNITQLLK